MSTEVSYEFVGTSFLLWLFSFLPILGDWMSAALVCSLCGGGRGEHVCVWGGGWGGGKDCNTCAPVIKMITSSQFVL